MSRRRSTALSVRATARLKTERTALVATLQRELSILRETTDRTRGAGWPAPRQLAAWQRSAARRLTQLLGWPLVGRRPASLKPRWHVLRHDHDGEVRVVRFGVTGSYSAFALLLLPPGGAKGPLVIAQHGGLGVVELVAGLRGSTSNYNDFVQRLRRRGCAVLLPQLPMWRDHAEPHCDQDDFEPRLKLMGGSFPALHALTLRRALDAALALPRLRGSRVGLAGMSFGGCHGLYAAALDSRISAVLTSGFFNDRHAYPLPASVPAGAAHSFLDAELGAMVCPRALWIETADRDELFDSAGARAEAAKVRKLYHAVGHAARFRFTVFPGRHEFNRSDAGLDFLVRALR